MVRYHICIFKSLHLQGVFLQTLELQISPNQTNPNQRTWSNCENPGFFKQLLSFTPVYSQFSQSLDTLALFNMSSVRYMVQISLCLGNSFDKTLQPYITPSPQGYQQLLLHCETFIWGVTYFHSCTALCGLYDRRKFLSKDHEVEPQTPLC